MVDAHRARSAGAGASLLVIVLLATLAAALMPACLELHDQPEREPARCATCHGDPLRAGDALLRAAPPHDVGGGTDSAYPGVGAHQQHLQASATHAAVACDECHVVPERVDTAGHADTAAPAEIVFGTLARNGGQDPGYGSARTCGNTYCHGEASHTWTEPRDSGAACGSCHALPPAAPHPASGACSACHGGVIDADRRFIAPEKHVDGVVDQDPSGCVSCHGSGDDPAPPKDTRGNTGTAAPGVGAHQAHLHATLGRPLACEECHVVPDRVEAPGHVDGKNDVVLTSVATSHGRTGAHFEATTSTCVESFCHGPSSAETSSSPGWTSTANLPCDGCHGTPPPAPHPQMAECSLCHGAVVDKDEVTIVNAARHVDGTVDVDGTTSCTACHGGKNPAPPTDTRGRSDTTLSSVGAHQTHVVGTGRSRAVPCEECHVVPASVLASGHLDSKGPAEVRFGGAAVANGADPAYEAGSCQNTPCHGAVFPDDNDSGGTNVTPAWTQVDGTQATCGSCHALPPPPPHPNARLNPTCSACHQNIAADNRTFVRPDLHVDGQLTLELPR